MAAGASANHLSGDHFKLTSVFLPPFRLPSLNLSEAFPNGPSRPCLHPDQQLKLPAPPSSSQGSRGKQRPSWPGGHEPLRGWVDPLKRS